MQKIDVYKHIRFFDKWEGKLTPKYIEEGLTKENSKLYIEYFKQLGEKESKGHCNRTRSKLKSIFIGLQNKGVNDVAKATLKQVEDYFYELKKSGYTEDYAKRWNAFWNWWKAENRREGKVVIDLTLSLKNFKQQNSGESNFVWLTKEEFDKFRSYFDEDKQVILLFCFDSLIRFPTEILSLKVENIFQKNGEVWVQIPKEISKTIGRKFNLVYSGEALLSYIKRHDKKSEDYLFEFSPAMFNQEMQRAARQLWDDKKSEGGEFYKNITGYDLRHSGAVHFRELFQKTGQSLDLLRERGGWNNFDIINYYTKRLGLDGYISKEKLLLEEDKSKIQKELEVLKGKEKTRAKQIDEMLSIINFIKNDISKIKNR